MCLFPVDLRVTSLSNCSVKLKTAREISQSIQSKREQVQRSKLMQRIDEYATKWCEIIDQYNSADEKRRKMRDELISFVEANGNGEELLSSGTWVISAKKIKSTPKIDGKKLAKVLSAPKYKKYRAMVLREEIDYVVDENKLIQLVQRGILSHKVLVSTTKLGGDRGYRLDVAKNSKKKSSNAIT